jgi:hypothetical protein
MRRQFLVRPLLLVGLVGIMFVLAHGEVFSQARRLPKTRPPIFLNNNASLYTFPNPNFGKPSQLPFGFVAVAHEDCRLYNNGAKLMPKHRMLAAECCIDRDPMTGLCRDVNPTGLGQGVGGIGLLPPCPVPYELVPYLGGLVPWCPAGGILPPVVVGPDPFPIPVIGGYNANRYQNSYGSGYAAYNPTAGPVNPSTGGTSAAQMASRAYRGFGTYTESNFGGFTASLGTDPYTRFGRGFGHYHQCCGKPEIDPEAKPAEEDKPEISAEPDQN